PCRPLIWIGPLMLFDLIGAFDYDQICIDDPQYGAPFTLILAGDDDHIITFPYLSHKNSLLRAYSTSGASETIFMKRAVRSSRVTGPKIRVPIGSSLAFSSTAALLSNLISDPSIR